MSSSSSEDEAGQDLHLDVIYVPSLGNDLTSDEHGSADSKRLPSLLDACLPNYVTKINFEYRPSDVIQGLNSRNAIRDLALKLLFQLQDHKMSWTGPWPPIVWVGHGLGGTIIKEAITIVALDVNRYRNIMTSTSLFVFLDCIHRAASPFEIVNKIGYWTSRAIEPQSPVLSRSIDALGASVTEINETFLETKIPQSTGVVSIRSSGSPAWTNLDKFDRILGIIPEKVLDITEDNSREKAQGVLEQEINKAATDVRVNEIPWLEVTRLLSAPSRAVFDLSPSEERVLSWIPANDMFKKWHQSNGPLALQLHGPRSSDAIQIFCRNETNMIGNRRRIVVHFTFDRHDNRRHSALEMATSLIAQITSSLKLPIFAEKRFSQVRSFRAWTLSDALNILERSTYGPGIAFVLEDFDQCDPASRQLCLDMFKRMLLMRDSKSRLLVTTRNDMLTEWPGEPLTPDPKRPTSSHQDQSRFLSLQVDEAPALSTISPFSDEGNDTGENGAISEFDSREDEALKKYLKLRFIDADFSEASAQELIGLVLSADDIDLRNALLLQLKTPAPVPSIETLMSLANSQSLRAMFKQSLERIPESERQLVRHILSWIVYSVRPLSIQELSAIVLWTHHGEVLDSSNMTKSSSLSLISPIVSLLWGILLIDGNEVRLVHHAARELLSRPGSEWFNIGRDAHLHIVLSCLDLLSRQEFLKWMDESQGYQRSLDDQDLFLSRSTFEDRTTLHQYVITNWPEHYRLMPASLKPKHEVVAFFEKESGRVWQSWARSRWIMSNPINRGARQDTFSKGALPFVAEIGDLELLKLWEKVSGNQNQEDIGNALIEASRVGAGDIVDHLLKHGVAEASQLQAALVAAASSAESEVLMVLVSAAPEGFVWPTSLLIRVSELGFEDCARALLIRGCNPDTPDGDAKTTALIKAIRNGNARMCDLLLQHNANPNDSGLEGASTIGSSVRGAEVIKTLVAHKIDVMAKDKSGNSALNESCRLGHFEIFRVLVDIAKDLEHRPSFAETERWLEWTGRFNYSQTTVPLLDLIRADPNSQIDLKKHLRNAFRWGRLQFARLLVENCKDLISPLEAANHGWRPWLCEVCDSPDADLDDMKLLMEAGAEVDPHTELASPLKSAARSGRLDFVKFLIEHGALVNSNESTKIPVLSEAARSGNVECVRFLLESGAEIEWKDEYGETAMFEAAEARHFDVVNFLLDQGAAVSGRGFEGRTLSILCISSSSTLRRTLEHGSEIDTKDDSGWAPIHYAAAAGNADAISVLSEFKAELNLETSGHPGDETTPLILAVSNGHCESIRALLEAGASVDYVVTQGGFTALRGAKTSEVVELLLQYSPDVNAASSNGSTALTLRTDDDTPDFAVIKRLVNARANVNAVCKDSCCLPLMNLAWSVEHWPIIDYLLSKNADINMATFQHGSALHRACRVSDLRLVQLLHAAGAKADVGVGGYPGSPLQSACRSLEDDENVLAVMRYLIEDAQADVNQFCGVLGTALSAACQRESSKALEFLLDHGASCNIPDQAGRLPVHLAALATSDNFGHLVTLGCDVHAVDNTGRTVLQWAAQSGDVEIVETILSFQDVQVDRPDKDGWTALCWAARGIASEAARPPDRNPEAQGDIINLLLKHGANKSLQVPGDAEVPGDARQTWNPLQIAIFHNSGEKVKSLLTEKQEAPGTDKRKQHPSLRRGHRQGTTGDAYCDCCLSYLTGTGHKCKSCPDFCYCFKCITHWAEIHDPTHEFESIGPTFDESDSAEDKESDSSDDEESEVSIALGSD